MPSKTFPPYTVPILVKVNAVFLRADFPLRFWPVTYFTETFYPSRLILLPQTFLSTTTKLIFGKQTSYPVCLYLKNKSPSIEIRCPKAKRLNPKYLTLLQAVFAPLLSSHQVHNKKTSACCSLDVASTYPVEALFSARVISNTKCKDKLFPRCVCVHCKSHLSN